MGPLEIMMDGNQRYVSRFSNPLNGNSKYSREVVCKKKPYAAVVACFDSPITPEVLFDCDSRDLVLVKVAGNLINDGNLVRLEYAVQNFGVSLIVVLGHEQCRMVQAALKGEKVSGYMSGFVKVMAPTIEAAHDNSVDAISKMHTRLIAEDILRFSELFREKVDNRSLQVVAGFYYSGARGIEWQD